MKKYNLSEIMKRAWKIYRKAHLKITTFGEALHRAWMCAKVADENKRRIDEAIREHGITEKVRTHYGWELEGREVIHESKNLFQVVLEAPERGDGKTFRQSFFGYSQTAEIGA